MKWDSIPLRDVLQISKAHIHMQNETLYPYTTLRSYPNGLSLKGQKKGADFRGKQQQVIYAGQFVISRTRIQQRHWGIVQPELNEAIVHRITLCFDIHLDLNTNYFAAYLATPLFEKAVVTALTKRGRLDVRRFMRIGIPFPASEDQARIAETWQQSYRAMKHTSDMYQSIAEIKAGVASDLFRNISRVSDSKLLGECAVIERGISLNYQLYVNTDGKLLRSQPDTENDLIGIVPNTELDHQFLYYSLEYQKQIWQGSIGGTWLSLENALRGLQIPMPSLYEQRKIASILQQHDDVLQKLRVEQRKLRYLTQGMMQQIFEGTLPLEEAISLMYTL